VMTIPTLSAHRMHAARSRQRQDEDEGRGGLTIPGKAWSDGTSRHAPAPSSIHLDQSAERAATHCAAISRDRAPVDRADAGVRTGRWRNRGGMTSANDVSSCLRGISQRTGEDSVQARARDRAGDAIGRADRPQAASKVGERIYSAFGPASSPRSRSPRRLPGRWVTSAEWRARDRPREAAAAAPRRPASAHLG